MADLIEYVRWRGDLSFRERPFNEVDNLVFCQMVYHTFDALVPGPESRGRVLLRKAAYRVMKHPGDGAIGGVDPKKTDDFLKAVAESNRFGSVKMSDYVNEVRDDPNGTQTQFAAVLFHLPDRSKFIVFRGTDNTVVGWREDFMASYKETAAQKKALQYTEELLAKYRFVSGVWRMGGHSKGGNLAGYTAARLKKPYQDKIEAIYNNDGPGFAHEVFGDIQEILENELSGKYHKLIPTFSIVGLLFTDREVRLHPASKPWLKVVASSAKGVMQHWILTWQVLPDRFEERNAIESGALTVLEILEQWVDSASLEEREAFIATLFDSMEKQGTSMEEAMSNTPKFYTSMVGDMISADDRTRRTVGKLMVSVGNVVGGAIRRKTTSVADTTAEMLKSGSEKVQKLLRNSGKK